MKGPYMATAGADWRSVGGWLQIVDGDGKVVATAPPDDADRIVALLNAQQGERRPVTSPAFDAAPDELRADYCGRLDGDEQGEGREVPINQAAWADCSIPLFVLDNGFGVASDGWLLQPYPSGAWRRCDGYGELHRLATRHLARLLAATQRDLAAAKDRERQVAAALSGYGNIEPTADAVEAAQEARDILQCWDKKAADVLNALIGYRNGPTETPDEAIKRLRDDLYQWQVDATELQRDLAAVTAERDRQRERELHAGAVRCRASR